MTLVCPARVHSPNEISGHHGLVVNVTKAFSKPHHAMFNLPAIMPLENRAYVLHFVAEARPQGVAQGVVAEARPQGVGGGVHGVGIGIAAVTVHDYEIVTDTQELHLTPTWKGYTIGPLHLPPQELRISFFVGGHAAVLAFDDIVLIEEELRSPPPPTPPPPPYFVLWADGEGGPGGVQATVAPGHAGTAQSGHMVTDLSSQHAAHSGKYGYQLVVSKTFEHSFEAHLSLPPFNITDTSRVYKLSFWARVELLTDVHHVPTDLHHVPTGSSGTHGAQQAGGQAHDGQQTGRALAAADDTSQGGGHTGHTPQPPVGGQPVGEVAPVVAFFDAAAGFERRHAVHITLGHEWHQYTVPLVVDPHRLGHQIVTTISVGDHVGMYSFDDFTVSNEELVSPPPPAPVHAPSPPAQPPNVLLYIDLEGGDTADAVRHNAWPEGEMQVGVDDM